MSYPGKQLTINRQTGKQTQKIDKILREKRELEKGKYENIDRQ